MSPVGCSQVIPEAEETSRLAVVDLDWDHVSAEDILAMLRSFLQRGQAIERVAVYPSDYGTKASLHASSAPSSSLAPVCWGSCGRQAPAVLLRMLAILKLSGAHELSEPTMHASCVSLGQG